MDAFIGLVSRTIGVSTQTIELLVVGAIFFLVTLLFVLLLVLIVKFIRSSFDSGAMNEKKREKLERKQAKKQAKQEAKLAKQEEKLSRKQAKAEEKQKKKELKSSKKESAKKPVKAKKSKKDSEPVEAEQMVIAENESGDEKAAGPSDNYLNSVADELIVRKGLDSKGSKKKFKKQQNKQVDPNTNTRKTSRNLKKRSKKLKIPKTVQDSIPYNGVYKDEGIIEIAPGKFTKTYLLDDVNYQVAKTDEQEEMFIKYGEFLNSFDPTTKFQITINQRNINMQDFTEQTMLAMKGDRLDELREERNSMLSKKMLEGRNNLHKEKYLTVAVEAPDFESAGAMFARLDSEISVNLKKIGGAVVQPLTSAQRLEILHDIYNIGSEGMFGNNMVYDKAGNLVFDKDKFSFEIMHRMGLTTKDMIGPESFSFKSDYGMMGDTYFRALFIRKLPTFLNDGVLDELTKTDCNMITSLLFEPIDGEKALKMARAQIVNINANVVERQKQASKNGYSIDLISPELKDASFEATELFRELTSKNQKLFYMTLVIVHFAHDKEQLDSDTKAIQNIGRRLLLDVKKLNWQQENGLASVLPLCNNKLQIKRSLTTESAAVFMPYVNQELNDRNGGMYYGNNAISHNLIMFNRRNCKNGNGFILGTPGSGKSMTAKQEMQTVLLSSDDVVIVIDPEGEYYPMAELLDGEVIRIAAGTDVHINPFDIQMDYDSDDDPISIKSDFIVSLCENVAGGPYGLTASQRSLIDRCVKEVYKPFLNSLDPETGLYDKSKIPTLQEFYQELRMTKGYDANNLADSLEIYVTGSQNVFAFPTNVEYSKRFVVYDIKDIGSTMKSMGLLVVLDNIWNRIVEGRKEGKNVWFYIDEIYLLFKTPSSAEFLRNLYKRARKYGGIPTGITQNVSDLLENDTARTMISNSECIIMLNQAGPDRIALMNLLNISETLVGYVTNSSPGHGLLYDGVHIIPFVNELPRNTKQYWAMTTKLSEVAEREKQKEQSLTLDEVVEAQNEE